MAWKTQSCWMKCPFFLSKYRRVIEDLPGNLDRLSRVMIRNRKREVLKGEVVDRKAYKVEVISTPQKNHFTI